MKDEAEGKRKRTKDVAEEIDEKRRLMRGIGIGGRWRR